MGKERMPMTADERRQAFEEEYEALCQKYEMTHRTYDKWDLGHEEICVFDEKERKFWVD